ncbi:unnamed protein product, partial [Closterium sp. NIES-54]
EFKLYHGKGGLYIGKAVLKNNVFVLDFVPDLGTADSDGIVTFTSWTHPPDLDPDFSPEGFWYSHTIPEAERTRALATIQHSAAAETIPAAAETTLATANTASAAAETTAAAAATSTPLAKDRDPTGGFRGDRAFTSAADEADWDEQNVDNASDEAGPLPYCSVPIPMDDENPRESVNAETYFDLADTGYITPAEVNTNEAERIGPNFIPDPETELEALKERNTWKVVPIGVARNKTIHTGKWVFRVKTKADGTIDKFKARWVVRGFDQEHGRDFTETFVPVSRHTSLRIRLAIAAMKKRKQRQIDVANAFLYAPVDAEIYVELPHGSHGEPKQVCQLQKSLYGIKQAPRLWQQYLHARLTRIGFQQLPHDQGMYRLTKGDDYILLIVYVDDLLYIGSTDNVTTWFEGELQRDLTLTVSSTVTQYLGLNIQEGESAIHLNAAKYADNIAKRFALTPTTISTPYRYTAGNNKAESAPLKPAGIRDYQRKPGCLLFAAVTCRPDLSYSASQLATYLKRPEAEHMAELDRALHYLVSTPTIGLIYYKNRTTTPKLIGYVDADHAGDSDNRRSRTGYIYRLEPIGPISWQSSKQELIALSSAEAEYIALCSATKEGLYLRELLEEAKLAQLPSFSLFCDNQSAIRIANKNGFANRTKHIALRYFFVKDEIEKGRLELSYRPTSEMAADYLTKKLGKSKARRLSARITPLGTSFSCPAHCLHTARAACIACVLPCVACERPACAAHAACAARAHCPVRAAQLCPALLSCCCAASAAAAAALALLSRLLLLQPLLPVAATAPASTATVLLLPLKPCCCRYSPCCCCYSLAVATTAPASAATALLLPATAPAVAATAPASAATALRLPCPAQTALPARDCPALRACPAQHDCSAPRFCPARATALTHPRACTLPCALARPRAVSLHARLPCLARAREPCPVRLPRPVLLPCTSEWPALPARVSSAQRACPAPRCCHARTAALPCPRAYAFPAHLPCLRAPALPCTRATALPPRYCPAHSQLPP